MGGMNTSFFYTYDWTRDDERRYIDLLVSSGFILDHSRDGISELVRGSTYLSMEFYDQGVVAIYLSEDYEEDWDYISDELTFGSIFVVNDIEVRIGTVFSGYTSEFWQATFVQVPITLRNLRNESHRLVSRITVFGPDGTEVGLADSHVLPNNFSEIGNMRSGVETTAYMYFRYRGNGDYWIEFTRSQEETIEVRLFIWG